MLRSLVGSEMCIRDRFGSLWVIRIFTHTSISPSPLLRQCSTRYAFRAGRILPDKEFRYLRTVIVTAAVHRGFISELSLLHLTFRHWAGVSPYTSACAFAETCVFGKQSAEPFHCNLTTTARRSFSRSYGSILPNSLAEVLPFAFVFSTRLPVSVCGTVGMLLHLQTLFSSHGYNHFLPEGTASRALPACHLNPLRGWLSHKLRSQLHIPVREY